MKLLNVYRKLYSEFGPQHWWPADNELEVIIGAILTQNTSWKNVEKAIKNLKPISLSKMRSISRKELENRIRSSGFYKQKAERIKAIVKLLDKYSIETLKSMPVDKVRQLLLSVKGIGKETADSILLYALGKGIFVVDAYTKRIFNRLGFDISGYEEVRKFVETNLPANYYNEFHALLVKLAKEYCRKKPNCRKCPLKSYCSFYKQHYKE